jgi:hypothetical protein
MTTIRIQAGLQRISTGEVSPVTDLTVTEA